MGFYGGKCVKIFDRGTTGDAKIEILRGGEREENSPCERLPRLAR